MIKTHRRCNHSEHEGERYLPVEKFHKAGRRNGHINYNTYCKECVNRDNRIKYHQGNRSGGWEKEKKKAYLRARSRAATRITKLYPELYEKILAEELMKERYFRD